MDLARVRPRWQVKLEWPPELEHACRHRASRLGLLTGDSKPPQVAEKMLMLDKGCRGGRQAGALGALITWGPQSLPEMTEGTLRPPCQGAVGSPGSLASLPWAPSPTCSCSFMGLTPSGKARQSLQRCLGMPTPLPPPATLENLAERPEIPKIGELACGEEN